MAVCKSCSAPLAANTNVCRYCGVRNDVDLQEKRDYTLVGQDSERICPNCQTRLQTIDLKINGHFYIEHCPTCFGLFFDPGEIETVLESSVSGVFTVNSELIDNINQERYPAQQKVKYRKCPVCQVLMNRVNFGYRSGVVIDRCSAHGIWLDSGEITHLLEWKKAGGQLLHQQQAQQTQAAANSASKQSEKNFNRPKPDARVAENAASEFLKILAEAVFKVFG
jgi:Zn-finger nucleic acid-binding protein